MRTEITEIELTARERLGEVTDVAPAEFDLDEEMAAHYGLTSLNKVLFITAVCDDTGVELVNFTEQHVAAMRTLRDVIEAITMHAARGIRR
jgi:hypothetical protein